MKSKPVCERCQGGDIVINAHASWNIETQSWEMHDVFENTLRCLTCGARTNIFWVEDIETEEEKSHLDRILGGTHVPH